MNRKVLAVGLAALACALAPAVNAAPGKPARAPVKAPQKPVAPPAPPAPPPNVTLSIEAASSLGSWRMRVTNAGDVPVRLTADARLLSLDVTSPTAKKPITCTLPFDMRPSNDVDRALVLPPKRSYSETFDPRLYCFGASEAALVPGAKVVGRLGFGHAPTANAKTANAKAANAKTAPPYAVSPFMGVEPAVAALKEIASEPVTLTGDWPAPPGPPPPKPPGAGDDPFPVSLSLTVPRHIEASQSLDLSVTVTVENKGDRPVTLLFRPETIGFDLVGPTGAMRCGWPAAVGGAVREAFTTLPPKGKQSMSVLLESLCPGNAFDQGGLFIVRPRIDTREVRGDLVGVRSFSGEVIGAGATLLRIHHGRRPPPSARPALD